MDLKVLIQAMQEHHIDCRYINENMISIYGISLLISNNVVKFGTCTLRVTDIYTLCRSLSAEGLLDLSTYQASEIEKSYREMQAIEKSLKV